MSILIGLDPSRRSASGLALGVQLAQSLDTGLVVGCIITSSHHVGAGTVDTEWRAYTQSVADLVMEHAAGVIGDQVPAEYVVHESPSARRGLLELADQHEPELIVLGSARSGEHGRIALGSVSDALLHASPVPVAVAPVGYRTAAAKVGRVTAAYGGAGQGSDLIATAARLAARAGAALRVASFAVRPETAFGILAGIGRTEDELLEEWAADARDRAHAAFEEAQELTGHPALEASEVGIGESWAAAIQQVGWRSGDVLVVGSSSMNPLARVFVGTHAMKIIRNSVAPVIAVPSDAARDAV